MFLKTFDKIVDKANLFVQTLQHNQKTDELNPSL